MAEPSRAEMQIELARLLATLYAEDNTEEVLCFTFDCALIPTLGASEQIEVRVRRTHKRGVLLPVFDVAGAMGYVTG